VIMYFDRALPQCFTRAVEWAVFPAGAATPSPSFTFEGAHPDVAQEGSPKITPSFSLDLGADTVGSVKTDVHHDGVVIFFQLSQETILSPNLQVFRRDRDSRVQAAARISRIENFMEGRTQSRTGAGFRPPAWLILSE